MILSSQQGDKVTLNWILIKPGYDVVAFAINIPRKLYQSPSQDCRALFIDDLRREHEVTATEADILFWVPKEPLSLYDAEKPGWATSVDDFHARFDKISHPIPLSERVIATENGKLIHLIVTIRDRRPLIAQKMDQTGIDALPELREFTRYKNTILTPGPTPSEGEKLTEYRTAQANVATTIYDGRQASAMSTSTVAPPIQIFHPIFSEFAHQILSPNVQPTVDDLKLTQDFMYFLSVVGRAEEGSLGHNQGVRQNLTRILQARVHERPNRDGAITLEIGDTSMALVIIELKKELGEGGRDPTIQAGLSMKRSWIDQTSRPIREKCCCPTFLVAGGGPWLCVLGGVFTDKIIVQRLTDMRWMALSSTQEDLRVYHNSRVLVALRICIDKLRQFYLNLPTFPSFVANQPHPRYFPYPTSFVARNESEIHFRYLKSLEDNPACVTYLAEIVDLDNELELEPTKKIVVKFVARYCKEAHELLARNDLAPKLLYYGPMHMPDCVHDPVNFTSGSDHELVANAPPGLRLRSDTMRMVVMEYIQSQPKAPPDAHQQIHHALRLLHSEGYVFGDLRKQNILFDSMADGRVELIDFDWCGRFDMGIRDGDGKLPEGLQKEIDGNRGRVDAEFGTAGAAYAYGYYPLSMSTVTGMWASGMEALAPIRPRHDWEMFDRLHWE